MQHLGSYCFKSEVLVKIWKPHKLKDIDLSSKNNLIKPGEMGIGFAVDCKVKKLKQKGVVNLTDIKVFKKAAQRFLVAMGEKLLERTLLASSLLQSESVLIHKICSKCQRRGSWSFQKLAY